ncbi:MAG: DEAD/DEAH box helicase, partial [Clostridia bacterium]|nr:DEAD/DEAH box helicase [Clostridia bacterium]
MGLLGKIFPSHNDRELKKINKIVDKIEALEDKFKAMSDEELKACTQSYVERHQAGESLDSLLPEAFATVREASGRVLGMRHFRVQLIGGVVLYQGRIAEMRTGEGKTLVATLAAYLKAIDKKGVHVVTVNDYLAKRDAEWMGKIYKFLGLTVGVNYARMSHEEKVEAYNCDIMYSTNNELGFDYLRDNMVKDKSRKVQRELDFAIVDEVDSILVDEARTPLIISGRGGKPSDEYLRADRFVKTLLPPKEEEIQEEDDEESQEEKPSYQADFEIGEKEKSVFLNEFGAQKAEQYYGIENLSDYENQSLKHYID